MSLAHSLQSKNHLLSFASLNISTNIESALLQLGDDVLTTVDSAGNTFLHLAVIHNTFENVELIINKLKNKTLLLCKMVNNAGNTPLFLAHQISNEEHKHRLINLLLPLSLDLSVKPLHTLLNEQEVVDAHPEAKKDRELEENLRLGCRAANRVANGVTSVTHPEFNFKSEEEKIKAIIAVNTFRNSLLNRTITYNQYDKEADASGALDCDLRALKVMCHVLGEKRNQTLRVELIVMSPGDHALVLLDRRIGSKLENPLDYGKKAVFVDAWSREVYHPLYMQTKLRAHLSYGYYGSYRHLYNFLAHFNKDYHKLHSPVDITLMCPEKNTFSRSHATLPIPTLPAGVSTIPNSLDDPASFYVPSIEDYNESLRVKNLDQAELDKPNHDNDTLAIQAALKNHVATLNALGEHKANLNIQSTKGSPVTIAAEYGYLPSLRVLAKYKADFDAPILGGITAFYFAVQNNHPQVVEFLIPRTTTINSWGPTGYTPTCVAANGSSEIIMTLLIASSDLENSADLDKGSKDDGYTPLFIAAQNGRQSIVQLLIDSKRINVNKTTNAGRSPAYIAALNGHMHVLRTLAAAGANLVSPAGNGATGAHAAALNGHLDVFYMYAELGINFIPENNNTLFFDLLKKHHPYPDIFIKQLCNNLSHVIPQRLTVLKLLNEFIGHHKEQKAAVAQYHQCCEDIAHLDNYVQELFLLKAEFKHPSSVSSIIMQMENTMRDEYKQVMNDIKSVPMVHRNYCLSLMTKISDMISFDCKEKKSGIFAEKNKEERNKLITLIKKAEQKCLKVEGSHIEKKRKLC